MHNRTRGQMPEDRRQIKNCFCSFCPLSSVLCHPNGGGERDRTDGLLRARQALSQLSYTPESENRCQKTEDAPKEMPLGYRAKPVFAVSVLCPLIMVGLGGLEPPTSRLSAVRSNQLSYRPLSDSRIQKTEAS